MLSKMFDYICATILKFSGTLLGIILITILGAVLLGLLTKLPISNTCSHLGIMWGKVFNRLHKALHITKVSTRAFLNGMGLLTPEDKYLKMEYKSKKIDDKYDYLCSQEFKDSIDEYSVENTSFTGTVRGFVNGISGHGYKPNIDSYNNMKAEIAKTRHMQQRTKLDIQEAVDDYIADSYPTLEGREREEKKQQLVSAMVHKQAQAATPSSTIAKTAFNAGQKTSEISKSVAAKGSESLQSLHKKNKPTLATDDLENMPVHERKVGKSAKQSFLESVNYQELDKPLEVEHIMINESEEEEPTKEQHVNLKKKSDKIPDTTPEFETEETDSSGFSWGIDNVDFITEDEDDNSNTSDDSNQCNSLTMSKTQKDIKSQPEKNSAKTKKEVKSAKSTIKSKTVYDEDKNDGSSKSYITQDDIPKLKSYPKYSESANVE